MINSFFGFKLTQEQIFDEKGKRLVATRILTQPCEVSRIKSKEKDGYPAIVVKVPAQGGSALGRKSKKKELLREIKTEEVEKLKPGDTFAVDQIFKVGDRVMVSGKTKGKGFAGVVKRWGFAGGPKTHGQSDRERAPGSIGQRTTPGRVYKGKRMAGRMGGRTETIKTLKVFKVDREKGELWLTGLVPGTRGGLVRIIKSPK